MSDFDNSGQAALSTGIGTEFSAMLRGLSALHGPLPDFDPASAADTPEEQFRLWLASAIDAGVAEPHAMTLSTVDADGDVDARVLLLKNLDARGWQFASSARSAKGRQLAATGRAALTFYWPLLGRQVRVRGIAAPLPAAEGVADYQARSVGARAIASLERQSEPLASRQHILSALERIGSPADATTESWTLYALAASAVEFWQGDQQRMHIRLIYRRTPEGWSQGLLWP